MTDAFNIPVEGATLSGEQRGGGIPLVLVHGMGSSRAGWNRILTEWPPDLPMLRYDLRGFGASSADEETEYSHAEDLLALLDAREIERASLCGLSMGGAVAATFAIDYPDRVDKLVLVSPALAGWEWSEEWRALWREISGAARAGDMDRARALWWQHPMFATVRASEAAPEFRREVEVFAGRQWVSDPQRPVLPDVERLHQIAAPTLLLTGERDLADFRLIAELLTAMVPDIRRVDYPEAGHMLPLERPKELAAAIADFLG